MNTADTTLTSEALDILNDDYESKAKRSKPSGPTPPPPASSVGSVRTTWKAAAGDFNAAQSAILEACGGAVVEYWRAVLKCIWQWGMTCTLRPLGLTVKHPIGGPKGDLLKFEVEFDSDMESAVPAFGAGRLDVIGRMRAAYNRLSGVDGVDETILPTINILPYTHSPRIQVVLPIVVVSRTDPTAPMEVPGEPTPDKVPPV